MKEEVYVPDPLNEQASVLVDAQTDIKTAIKEGVLSGAPISSTKKRVQEIIVKALARIRSPTLRGDAEKSLKRFANVAYGRFMGALRGIPAAAIPAAVILMRAITESDAKDVFIPQTAEERKAAGVIRSILPVTYEIQEMGIPLQEFQKVYIDRVSNALEGLARENALDPNDVTGRNSLRNLAEMQVRYEKHQEEIAGFRENGTKLVVCSVHGDCSDRCRKWQGGIYSLDGTSGVTKDGRKYQPLENATDIFYTTKAGRTYKNGLLGFNCRHNLYEYKVGMGIPTVSAQTQKREYAITQSQRAMEREVVHAREKALAQKNVNVKEYRKWKKIALERYEEYKRFSKEHGRAYYPDRVKIL